MRKESNLERTADNKKSKKSRMAVKNTALKMEYKHTSPRKSMNHKSSNNMTKKIMMILLIIVIAMVFIFTSGAFHISEIIVEGNVNISDEQIISFSGIKKGTNLFAISNKNIKNNTKENSYINDVEIKRILPDKIKLIVDERNIDYALQLANSYIYIDRQGYVLDILSEKLNVPIILGLTTDLSNMKENNRLEESDLKKLNIVIKIMETATNNDIANLITKIDISNEENYTIYLENEGKIAYLGNGLDLNTRFLYIKAILKEQQGKKGEIFVDMDLNSEYVYFRESI